MKLMEETPFFDLYKLSEGIYAAIAKPGQGAWSNAGFVDLGNETLVFDAFNTPTAAAELKIQAEKHTGNKVSYVINSHYHGDHVFGNQVFVDAVIISTETTRNWFKEKNILGPLTEEQQETALYLQQLQQQILAEGDGIRKASLINQQQEMEKLLQDLPELELVAPTMTFKEHLTIHGAKRSIELHCLGGGHTASDAFMYVPGSQVLFAADLLTENLHVPIYDIGVFRSTLKAIGEFDANIYVPGHGNIGGRDLLAPLADYLALLEESAKEAATTGITLEAFIKGFTVPESYRNWRGITGMERNLESVYRFHTV